jgi:hypothetical protein
VDGLKKSAVSQFFTISHNTIDLWLKRKAANGDWVVTWLEIDINNSVQKNGM